MIDSVKFQVETLKNMLSKDPRMKRVEISDSEVGITEGHYIVVFNKKDLKIKWEDLPIVDYDVSAAVESMPELFDSKVRKKIGPGRTLAKLQSKDKSTFSLVNEKFLNMFSGCSFFSNGGTNTIYVFGGIGGLVGVILPVRGEEF